jgi:hypothetical protein
MADRILDSDGVDVYQDAINEAAEQAGITGAGNVRRGKAMISAAETRSSTSYGLLATADRVSGLLLPTDGIIAVAYKAVWIPHVAGTARAAIFLNGNQLQVRRMAIGGPAIQAAASWGSDAVDSHNFLTSSPGGLVGLTGGGTSHSPDAATGQAVATIGRPLTDGVVDAAQEFDGTTVRGVEPSALGGPCYIWADAGTYDVSVQFKTTDGSLLTVQDRKLWIWTLGF